MLKPTSNVRRGFLAPKASRKTLSVTLLALGPTMGCCANDTFRSSRPFELRSGVRYHDAGIVTTRYESGVDLNLEMLFDVHNATLNSLGAPRPHLGLSLNSERQTDVYYSGLTWNFELFTPRLEWGFSLGAAYHTGHLSGFKTKSFFNSFGQEYRAEVIDQKGFGTRFLFRESLFLGFQMTENQGIYLSADHISNAYLSKTNDGMDTVGIFHVLRF